MRVRTSDAAGIEIRRIPLGFDTCDVLRGDGVIVVDAGQPKRGRAFLRGLSSAGIEPSEVDLILLTHAHWAHMGSAAEIRELTGAPLAVHEREVCWVERGDPPLPPGVTPWGRVFMAVHRAVMPLIDVPSAAVDRVPPDEPLSLHEEGIPAQVIPTPGHSPATDGTSAASPPSLPDPLQPFVAREGPSNNIAFVTETTGTPDARNAHAPGLRSDRARTAGDALGDPPRR